MKSILLPGTEHQLNYLLSYQKDNFSPALFIGTGNELCAEKYAAKTNTSVEHIVEDYNSMINAKIATASSKNITTRIMDFSNTDFNDESFELVFAQASTSNPNRNKIVKEVRRIMRTGALFCVGEIFAIKNNYPVFVREIIKASDLNLLNVDEITSYYESRNFTIVDIADQKSGLDEYYQRVSDLMEDSIKDLDERELKYHKKLIKKANHETDAYLKLGLNKYITFKTLILKKNESEEK